MFDLEAQFAQWRRQMAAGGLRTPKVLDELESHLREDVEQQVRSGANPQQAFAGAVQRMGHPTLLQGEFEKSFAPKSQGKLMAVVCFFLVLCIVLLSGYTFVNLEMSLGGKILGLAGVAMTLLAACAWRYAVPFLPVLPTARVKKIQMACGLAGLLWLIIFGYFILPHVEHVYSGDQPLSALMWDFFPVAVLLGLVLGLEQVPADILAAFSQSAQRTLELAQEEAPRFHHCFIGTEHMLLGLLGGDTGIVPNVLRNLGVERETVRLEIEKFVGMGPEQQIAGPLPYTPRARRALLLAKSEAESLNYSRVGPEHIFLGLIREGDGVAARVLKNLGVELQRTREEILKASKLET